MKKKKLVAESLNEFEGSVAEPGIAEPTVKPGTKERPSYPSPIPRHRPSVDPRPKATLKDVIKKFTDIINLKEK